MIPDVKGQDYERSVVSATVRPGVAAVADGVKNLAGSSGTLLRWSLGWRNLSAANLAALDLALSGIFGGLSDNWIDWPTLLHSSITLGIGSGGADTFDLPGSEAVDITVYEAAVPMDPADWSLLSGSGPNGVDQISIPATTASAAYTADVRVRTLYSVELIEPLAFQPTSRPGRWAAECVLQEYRA